MPHLARAGFMLSNLIASIIDKCPLIEQPCLLCGLGHHPGRLCPGCDAALPRLDTSLLCPTCAGYADEHGFCARCDREGPLLDALHVPFAFDYPLDAVIRTMKYRKHPEYGPLLGALLAANTPQAGPDIDLVIPVPLSKERLAQRGFNQSDALARAIAGTMPQRFSPDSCVRKRNTPSQSRLSAARRARNLDNAFCVETSVDGLSVAIVDDVLTTGTTLSTLAFQLRKQGVKRVSGWVLTRALFANT